MNQELKELKELFNALPVDEYGFSGESISKVYNFILYLRQQKPLSPIDFSDVIDGLDNAPAPLPNVIRAAKKAFVLQEPLERMKKPLKEFTQKCENRWFRYPESRLLLLEANRWLNDLKYQPFFKDLATSQPIINGRGFLKNFWRKTYPHTPSTSNSTPEHLEKKEEAEKVGELTKWEKQRFANLEEQIELLYRQRGEFEKDLIVASGSRTRFQIQEELTRIILPKIRNLEQEYAQLLCKQADPSLIPDWEAKDAIAQLMTVVEKIESNTKGLSAELKNKLNVIQKEIENPDEPAAAKLKFALPMIPLILSYEIELSAIPLIENVWREIIRLFRR